MIIKVPTILFIINKPRKFIFFRNLPTRNVINNHQDTAPTKILAKPSRIENSFSSRTMKFRRAKSAI